MNFDLDNYINEMQEVVRNKQEELVIKSIIDIYNNVYSDYEEYYHKIMAINNQIEKENSQFKTDSMTIEYRAKLLILPKRTFDMIVKFKELEDKSE